MTQHSKAGGKASEAGRRKAATSTHPRSPPKHRPRRRPAETVWETELARLSRELDEAREQQTATSEVLKVISSSPGELVPVFNAMLEYATRICDATFGSMLLREGDAYRRVALHNAPRRFAEFSNNAPILKRGIASTVDRVIDTGQASHVLDVAAEYPDEPIARFAGARTLLVVPLMKAEEAIGILGIYRHEVRPFSDRQIELATNFAAQAVIAIENARLLNELRQRTTDLGEALEQQTATSEVLRIISTSAGALAPVFEAMLDKAMQLCEAAFGGMWTLEAGRYTAVALRGVPQPYAAFLAETTLVPGPGTAPYRFLHGERFVHNIDLASEEAYRAGDPQRRALVDLGGARTAVQVPLCKDESVLGVITIYRQEVRPFSDKQIALVQNFAAQAVIAIENARLLNELRQRTADLTEALEQQTATSDVLRIISSSPGELQPVFEAILENATRICQANFGILNFYENGGLRMAAMHDVPFAFADWLQSQRSPYQPMPGSPPDRVIRTKKVCHVVDNASEPSPGRAATLGGARSTVTVPILKENVLIALITIYRKEVRPFTDKQIALLASFANQAVIAIENARLLDDLNKLNQQLEQRVTDQVGEIERMSRLRRFLPPQVADLIVASGTEKQLESHRREITALFCDLRGFTGFSESSDPEDVMALLRDYHAAIGQIVIKYNGTLERYAGDGVMVVFNDPVPVENPALQAVLMALEMRNAIGALTETWRRWGHDIDFGIGVAHGFATLGTIGFEGRFDYAAIGTVSNVASRLCDEAKPGQILISPRVLTKVENAVTFEPVGEFALKGIRRPMAAFNVLSAKT